MDKLLRDVAMGTQPADAVVQNGQLVNVHTKEIYPGGVAIAGNRIAAIGDIEDRIGDETEIIDAEGNYIVPGFLDGHIHPESSNISLQYFAEAVVTRGTTGVYADLHEIAVVGGLEAVEAALEEGKRTPLRYHFVVPSHVPFFKGLETSGGVFNPEIIQDAIQREDAVGLSECVANFMVIGQDELFEAMEITKEAGKTLAGHAPQIEGTDFDTFAASGVLNDHEAFNGEDVVRRVRNGIHVHLRHNIMVPTLPDLLKAVTEEDLNTRFLSLATDDTTPITLTEDGHLDYLVKIALENGIDFASAIQMVTLNPATSFHMEQEVGALAPGRYADINVVSGPEADDFEVLKTVSGGELVAQDGELIDPVEEFDHPPLMLNTFNVGTKVTPDDLVIDSRNGARSADVHVMRTLPNMPLTEGEETTLPVTDGHVGVDLDQDIVHIAVIERHHGTGNIGHAFLGGFGLNKGALGSSVAHDNHNIVVMGENSADMALAADRIAEMEGGIVAVEDGEILGEIELPIFGLLADENVWSMAEQRKEMLSISEDLGCEVLEPYFFLTFITLSGFPKFAVSDIGYIDCIKMELKDPVLQWNE